MTLDQTEADLEGCVIRPMPYQGSFLLQDVEVDLAIIKECQLKANSISQSAYSKRFRESIDRLVIILRTMVKFYTAWKGMQKLWAYMTPIFFHSDLSQQMKTQSEVFFAVDKNYRAAVKRLGTGATITYKRFYTQDTIKDNIYTMFRNLETLMKSLIKYIEMKREKFPRLYFLSNEQIIEMCGVAEDIGSLEKNFHKMFEGICKLIIVYKESKLPSKLKVMLTTSIDKEREVIRDGI